MIRPIPLLVALALGGAGCTSSVEPLTPARLGEPFWVDVHGLRAVPDASFTIRFVDVLEDSRCPNDALILCVWEGRVRIRLGVTSFVDGEAMYELRFQDAPSAVTVGRYRIELIGIAPEATLNLPAPGAYRAQVRVVDMVGPPAP